MTLGCKRSHKLERTFSGFSWMFIELSGSKVQLAPPHANFINGVANPEIVSSSRNKSEKNELGRIHVQRINKPGNLLVKIQGPELAHITKRITYATE